MGLSCTFLLYFVGRRLADGKVLAESMRATFDRKVSIKIRDSILSLQAINHEHIIRIIERTQSILMEPLHRYTKL